MMMSRRWYSSLLACFSVLSAPGAAAGEDPPVEATVQEFRLPLDVVDFSDGARKRAVLDITVGIGSSAFRHRSDPPGVFYTVSDRGPNINCDEDEEIIEADLCGAGRVFPVPTFTPSIYRFETSPNGYVLADVIRIKDRAGVGITGIPNPLTVTDTEAAYTRTGSALAFDPGGLDPEGLVRLGDGSFWLAEEYGPSLVHVRSTGEIIERVLPAGLATDLQAASYDLRSVLPGIIAKRKLNRGFESLAISPQEEFLYFMLESALANPDSDAHKRSRNVRLFKMALASGEIVGEYLYRLDAPETFAGADQKTPQSDVKINELVALATDRLLVVEGIGVTKRLYRIDLAAGQTNIAGSVWDLPETLPSLEQIEDPVTSDVVPLTKVLAFDAGVELPGVLPKKIEGLAILDEQTLLLVNDNDFGIEGDGTRFVTLRLGADLSQ